MVEKAIEKVDVLLEAFPYIREFQNKIFVVKYGGSILGEERVRKTVLEDVAFLRFMGIKPVLVHGGGPNITERLKQYKVAAEFVNGVRVTDEFTLKIVKEELSLLNDLIVSELSGYGVSAVGLKDKSSYLKAVKKKSKQDLGFVGEIVGFNRGEIEDILRTSIPVVIPMGVSEEGVVFNINADDAAFFLAAELKADKLMLLTNVLGVMRDPSQKSSLISTLKVKEARDLITQGVIESGMIPKVEAAVKAIEAGVSKAHIVDAKIPHAILLEIFTKQGIGTEFLKM